MKNDVDRTLIVPDAALPYIRMHRTHLCGDLKRLYAEDVARDYEMIKPHLPQHAAATLDSRTAVPQPCLWTSISARRTFTC